MKHAMSNDLPEVRSYRWDVEIVSYSVGSRCRDCQCRWYHYQISNNINASQPGFLPLERAMDTPYRGFKLRSSSERCYPRGGGDDGRRRIS
jgi:hypothetical protein